VVWKQSYDRDDRVVRKIAETDETFAELYPMKDDLKK
jgi:hypothetical protein